MSGDPIQSQIQKTVDEHRVVLFMKGHRGAPQCGFSAQVVGVLDSLVDDYVTMNVLENPELRQGIKDFSSWPTVPQLYVGGEFLGGCDIVLEMHGNGELEKKLGVEQTPIEPPTITVTERALEPLRSALQGSDEVIRLEVDARFNPGLSVGPREKGDIEAKMDGLPIALDRQSAGRANGTTIDYVETPQGPAFKIDNPNEPARVKAVSVQELSETLKSNSSLQLFDVRTPRERATAHIPGSRLLDDPAQDEIANLDRSTPLYFVCHHGGRSQAAAEHFLAQGFKSVFNVAGGIDAWSLEVDSSVTRY